MNNSTTGVTFEERVFLQNLIRQSEKIIELPKIENFGSMVGKTIKAVRYLEGNLNISFTDGTQIGLEINDDGNIQAYV